jgi:hypothetical protein
LLLGLAILCVSLGSYGVLGEEGEQVASRESGDTAHGGSWLDSFEDDSGIDWAMSDHLRLEEGSIAYNQERYTDAILAWQQVLEKEPDKHPDIETAIKDAMGKMKVAEKPYTDKYVE